MFAKTLPEFQDFLRSRRVVPEKNVPYYAHWASKFLAFSNSNGDLRQELRIKRFLSRLERDKKIAEWQVRQAKEALRLYLGHFLERESSPLYPNIRQEGNKSRLNRADMLNKMREAIRIKHYSYRTERSYLDWVKRFYEYVADVKRKDIHAHGLGSSDVRDFLSHLAIRQRVASSTQNQAFNALLFFFREVLGTDGQGKTRSQAAGGSDSGGSSGVVQACEGKEPACSAVAVWLRPSPERTCAFTGKRR